MARIRTIKPQFFRSLTMTELPITARLMFIGLWTYVDDAGRGVDDTRLIKSELWPLDDQYTLKKVEHDLNILAEKRLIVRYGVLNRNYLAVCNWKEHQKINRPQESSLPDHCERTDHSLNDHGTITDDSLWEGKGKERKGKEAQSDDHVVNDPLEEEFNKCWENYPKKVSRLRALKAYKAARRRSVDANVLALAVKNYADVVKRKDTSDDFILHGSTFFGPDDRWQDYAKPLDPKDDDIPSVGASDLSDDELAALYTGEKIVLPGEDI